MIKAVAQVPTENGGKYVRRLCKHWAYKLDVEIEGDRGVVRYPGGTTTMHADEQSIALTIVGEQAETVERLQGVIERHLDRFAFREAPLAYAWSAG